MPRHRLQENAASRRRPFSALSAAILPAGGVWLLSLLGVFAAVDGLVYDLCIRHVAGMRSVPNAVLLVELQPGEIHRDEEVIAILRKLEKSGAAGVVFAFPAGRIGEPTSSVADAPSGHRPKSGREALDTLRSSTRLPLVVPIGFAVGDVSSGPPPSRLLRAGRCVAGYPPATDGVYRSQRTAFLFADDWRASLELAAVRLILGEDWQGPAGEYYVHFAAGPGSLPKIDADALLDDAIVEDLIRDRVVLVGPAEAGPGLTTPTTSARKMSRLEFHGHAVNTLLAGAEIVAPSGLATLLILLTGATAALVACYRWPSRTGVAVLVLSSVETALAIASLLVLRVWIPLASLAAAQSVVLVVAVSGRDSRVLSSLRDLALTLSGRNSLRMARLGLLAERDPWPHVAMLVRQLFPVRRLAVLEPAHFGRRWRTAHVWNCPDDSVRTSVLDADPDRSRRLREGSGVVQLSAGNGVFTVGSVAEAAGVGGGSADSSDAGSEHPAAGATDGSQELQYLAPLQFGGKLFGVLAVAIPTNDLGDPGRFELRLYGLLEGVSELLHFRRLYLDKHDCSEFREGMESGVPRPFEHRWALAAVQALEHQMARLEAVLEESPHGLAVFDLSGVLLRDNRRMRRFFSHALANPEDANLVDVLAGATPGGRPFAQKLLRRLVIDRRPVELPVIPEDGLQLALLTLRPLELKLPQTVVTAADGLPFRVPGIVCELTETAVSGASAQGPGSETAEGGSSEDLVEHLTSLTGEIARAVSGDHWGFADGADRGSRSSILDPRSSSALALDARAAPASAPFAPSPRSGAVPVRAADEIAAAVRSVQAELNRTRSRVAVELPEELKPVFAAPMFLQFVLQAGLRAALGLAGGGASLRLRAEEREQETAFIIGVEAGAALAAVRDAHRRLANSPSVKAAAKWLESWDGRLTVSGGPDGEVTMSYVLGREDGRG